MDLIYRRSFDINDLCADCYGRLKSSMLLYFAQEVAGNHAALLGAGGQELLEKRLFWAIIRTRVQVTRMPQKGETITLETWPTPTTRVAYPRAVMACDAQGNVLFRTLSLWVLMDMDTRTMVLPGKSGVPVHGTLRGTELDPPGSLIARGLPNTASRTVTYSLLDVNGHMNNTRYLDWMDDLLPAAFHKTHSLKEMTVCYLSEALEGQQMDLQWDLSEDGLLQVDAHRTRTDDHSKKERVFSAQMLFE